MFSQISRVGISQLHLPDLDEGVGHLRRVGTLGLGSDWGDLGAGALEHVGGALHGVEGGGLAGGGYDEHVNGAVLEARTAQWQLTLESTGELLELCWTSDLGGALGGHRGHLWRSHAKRGCHCDGFGLSEDGLRWSSDGFDERSCLLVS